MTEWLLLGLGVVLTLGTGVFVAAEFSMLTLDRLEVERDAAAGDKSAQSVLAGLKTLSTQLSGAQVGITMTTLLVGFLVEPSVSRLLQNPLLSLGLPEGSVTATSVALGMVLATTASMLLGELIPKNLAIAVPFPTARIAVPMQRAFTWAMTPLISILNGSANAILRGWGIEPAEELGAARSAEELVFMVRRSAEAGTLDEGAANLLARTLSFSSHTAEDVMTHRTRLQTLAPDEPVSEVLRLSRRTGYSRFPVVGESLDDVVGIVHVKAAVSVPHDRRDDVPVGAIMTEPLRVPETMPLDPLLVDLREHGMQLALVVDEYGGTAGIVTLEDVIEELVGEVADEHDRARSGVMRGRDGSLRLPGTLRPDELRDRLSIDVPDHHAYETLGGFVMARLGRLAMVGDEVVVDGGVLRVERMAGRRVDRVRYLPAGSRPGGATAVGASGGNPRAATPGGAA